MCSSAAEQPGTTEAVYAHGLPSGAPVPAPDPPSTASQLLELAFIASRVVAVRKPVDHAVYSLPGTGAMVVVVALVGSGPLPSEGRVTVVGVTIGSTARGDVVGVDPGIDATGAATFCRVRPSVLVVVDAPLRMCAGALRRLGAVDDVAC